MQWVRSDTRKLTASFILFQFFTSPFHRFLTSLARIGIRRMSMLYFTLTRFSASTTVRPQDFCGHGRRSPSPSPVRTHVNRRLTVSKFSRIAMIGTAPSFHRQCLDFSHLGSPSISFAPFHVFRTILRAAASHTVSHRARNSERSGNTASVWLPLPDAVRVPHRSFANLTLFTY